MTDSKQPPLAQLDSAFDSFAATSEQDTETGRVLVEAAAALEEAQTEIVEEIIPVIDEALAAATALLDDAEAKESKNSDQEKIDSVQAQLKELDDSGEE